MADAAGRVHLVWRGRTGGPDDIFHAMHDGVAWSLPLNLSTTAEAASNPSIALSNGGVHVVWEQQVGADTRFYQTHHDGVAWEPASDTGLPYAGARIDSIRIAAEPDGTLHVAWQDLVAGFYEILHSERPSGGAWSAPDSVSASTFEDSVEPSVAVDDRQTLHVAWIEQDALDGRIFEVAHAAKPRGAGWGPIQNVSRMGGSAFRPVVAAAAGRPPVIAWDNGGEIYFVDSVGETPRNLSLSPGAVSGNVTLGLDRGGVPCLAWEEAVGPGNVDIFVTCACAEVEWSCCNGVDDDCDGSVDTDCGTEICCDGVDNDCDGLLDLADDDCLGAPDCSSTERACFDGEDDDGDGFVDCADPDCCGVAACAGEPACAGLDSDGDGVLNGDDCAPQDPTAFTVPVEVAGLLVARGAVGEVDLSWSAPPASGSGTTFEVAAAALDELWLSSNADAPCAAVGLIVTAWTEAVPTPGPSRYYLVRAANSCGPASATGWGLTSESLERPACP